MAPGDSDREADMRRERIHTFVVPHPPLLRVNGSAVRAAARRLPAGA